MRLGSGTFATCCVAIEVLGIAVFLRGFFPAPVRSSARAEHGAEPPAPEPSAGASSNWTTLPPPLFSKVVIVLIDALRDDFVFGSKGVKFMPYTTYLVEKGASHSFVAEAKPPTVTMPRIKVSSLLTAALKYIVHFPRTVGKEKSIDDGEPSWLCRRHQESQFSCTAGRQCDKTSKSSWKKNSLLWR
uniref:Phosphatidylinositol glycan anchor biosynthesis class G (EMM blood group) n=1 Tax=Pan paniscus TaxID=9597 RepID=A0A2R9AA10_PANPA